ncbi:hypothetical protein QTP86_006951 [Hemibagrus guttatus]|nr:hypothetical protein QTP86_006951 [Hemibagrus guttatus]
MAVVVNPGLDRFGKGRELGDMMERRKVDILCVQETRWKCSKARSIGAGFKLFYYGVDSKRNGVGVVLKLERNVLEVKRVSDRVMSLKLEIEGVMLNVVSGYAPQVGCELEEKEKFWSELDEVMESIPTGERVVIGADFNGHVGEGNTGDEEVMGKFGVKERNLEGQMVVDFAKRMNMAVVNTYFWKREEHRVTYKSGDLENAYDRVPREELWYCMRKSGVAEKYVRVVQDMYERSRTVVRCAVGQTEEFKVEVGLHQGSALSPFLLAIVMDQLSEEIFSRVKDARGKRAELHTPAENMKMSRVFLVLGFIMIMALYSDAQQGKFLGDDKCTGMLHNNQRELQSAERKWKKSQLDTDLISYRTLLSKFSLDVTSAKTSFYKEKFETSAQDPRKLHNIFSSLLNPPGPPAPSSLTAKDFATFYTEKIEKIYQTFTSARTSSTSHSQHSATPSLKHLSTVAPEEVLQIIRSCNPTTCPLDPIPSTMLQTISPDLLPSITTVINGSLTSGHVPIAFKKARVIPILKKPALDPSDISNYRLVSILSFLSKILKHIVYNQLSDYLLQNNLHDPNQSGFKAAHSTETALLAVTEKLHAARSAKLSSVLLLLDLSAEFDTVNHKTLLSTLRSLGICGTAWEWFASYLDGLSYQTAIGIESISNPEYYCFKFFTGTIPTINILQVKRTVLLLLNTPI